MPEQGLLKDHRVRLSGHCARNSRLRIGSVPSGLRRKDDYRRLGRPNTIVLGGAESALCYNDTGNSRIPENNSRGGNKWRR